ncbi:hypothetical protein GCM10009555_064660 [Acrocarpospora macrocephala]|uniref:AB hydrolase-1 domain-containing protein n=1 Tax=Acrocarpospora macrocephala TaxID=150177 RepID=A0A5M3WH30_9ACTN|nr:alpha/beta fold hydrolase [Acrocarpospora macrocephala]GES07600.1 hypothetical protein Amac_011950 [Acrocarpospora macrocephala]
MSPLRAVAIIAAFVVSLGAAALPAQSAARAPITVGSLTLEPCETSTLAWCATVQVPFSYADPQAGTTGLYFEWFPATANAQGTVLAVEGGPGYSSTSSRDYYLDMLGPLTRTRNVLIADLRGTGRSDPVRCPRLQNATTADGNQAYLDAVGACGRRLNHTRQRPDGSYVRGSDLYTTANAARDIARLLDLLSPGRVDLYGDSYGTYFAQVFTSRYAAKLRSVILDAAYPVLDADPFYPDAIETARTAFDLACARSTACGGWATVEEMVSAVRAAPFTGETKDPDGTAVQATVNVDTMIQLVLAAGPDSGVYRELDPAIRAYLDRGDKQPILRLTARTVFPDEDSGPAAEFSAGLYSAVFCNDYPQPFAYTGDRAAQYQQAVAVLPEDMFAPFTVEEWTTSGAEEFDSCLKWPKPAVDDPPIVSGTPIAPPSLPVLVLSGELDSLTTPADGERVAQHMGPHAQWVQVSNMIHVSALLDYVGCAEGLVRTFIRHPSQPLDASCAAQTPEVRLVDAFPAKRAQAVPAVPGPGNQAGAHALRLATIGAAVVEDAIWQWYYVSVDRGVGLRGGTFRTDGDGPVYTLTFRNVRWTTDVKVSGSGKWNRETGHVTATLDVVDKQGLTAAVTVAYDDYEPNAVISLIGSADGKPIVATAS